MLFADNFIHADLHPGNINVHRRGGKGLAKSELVIFDAGLAVQMSPKAVKSGEITVSYLFKYKYILYIRYHHLISVYTYNRIATWKDDIYIYMQ